jgi:hypothetical protein
MPLQRIKICPLSGICYTCVQLYAAGYVSGLWLEVGQGCNPWFTSRHTIIL